MNKKSKKKKLNKPTDKQKQFIKEYCKDFNATRAAIRAGYSRKTARQQATRLLSKAHIREEIKKQLNKLSDKADITVQQILEGLKRIAFLDPRKIIDKNDNIKNIQRLDDDSAMAIAGIEIDEIKGRKNIIGITKKIKFNNRENALELLGKYLDMFDDKSPIPDKIDINITLKDEDEKTD